MTGGQVAFTRLVGISMLTNVVLNLCLIPWLGMEGAAWATLVSTIIWNVGGAWWIWRKHEMATFYQPFRSKTNNA